MMLGYPLFLILLEKSIRDLNYGETVEFMGVTLTAAAVGFLIPVMFPDTGIRALASQVIDKIRDNQIDESLLVIGRIKRVHKNESLSNYANLLFALTLPAWFFSVLWSITPNEVIYWFGLPSPLVVGFPVYFPAAALSIAKDSLKI
jgi:hypothetical protein